MSLQHRYDAAWCFDIYHSTGTINAATRDLTEAQHVTDLGAAYLGYCLPPNRQQIVIRRRLNDTASGIDIPETVSGVRFQARGKHAGSFRTFFDAAQDWNDTPVRIRHYDLVTSTVTMGFDGVIIDEDFLNGEAVFSFGSQLDNLLDQLIPPYTITEDELSGATSLGAAIPVVYGSNAVLLPPFIKRDTTATATDPGGHVFALSWKTATAVKVYGETDNERSGLDLMSTFDGTAPGSPTYASTSTFTVTGPREQNYTVGRAIRFQSPSGSGTYLYSHITGYSSGTVTIADAILDTSISNVELASEYEVARGDYSINGTDLTTIRARANVPGGIAAYVTDRSGAGGTTVTNPADVIKDILEGASDEYGLGETANSSSFSTASTAASNAGLGSAVQAALAWDGRQRPAREVLTELLALYGGRLWRDGASGEWKMTYDAAPSAATLTFGHGDGTYNNIIRVISNGKTPSQDRASTLELRYALGGYGSKKQFHETDYQYRISRSVLSTGSKKTILCPWIRDHTVAKRVLWYRGKTLEHGDRRPVIEVGQEARSLSLGDLVTYTNTVDNISGTFRVYGIDQRIDSVVLYLRGYNSEIFSFSDDVTTPTDVDPDEASARAKSASNVLVNGDWAARFRASTVPGSLPDYTSIPGWIINEVGSTIQSITQATDFTALGNKTISVTTSGPDAAHASSTPRLISNFTDAELVDSGHACIPGEAFFFSVYSNQSSGFRLRFAYYQSAGVASAVKVYGNPPLYADTNDTDGSGRVRYYSFDRVPSDATLLNVEIVFLTAQTTVLASAQLERAGAFAVRPQPWMTPRPVFSLDEIGQPRITRKSADTPLSGSSTNLLGADGNPLIPAGVIVHGLTAIVTSTITSGDGATSWRIGDDVQTDAWGGGLAFTDGTEALATTWNRVNPLRYTAAKHVTVTSDSGTFSGGTVCATLYYELALGTVT